MDILDDMGVSKLSAKVFSKVNYSFNIMIWLYYWSCIHRGSVFLVNSEDLIRPCKLSGNQVKV